MKAVLPSCLVSECAGAHQYRRVADPLHSPTNVQDIGQAQPPNRLSYSAALEAIGQIALF